VHHSKTVEPLEFPDKTIYSYRELMELNNFTYSKQMPHWFFRIPYCRFGYRYHPAMDTCMCTKSLFQLHNQTMNIYTHLLPAIYFAIELGKVIAGVDCYASFTLKGSFATQIIAALSIITCMVSSSCFHLYMPLGRKYYQRWLRMDLISISIMIFGLTATICYVAMND